MKDCILKHLLILLLVLLAINPTVVRAFSIEATSLTPTSNTISADSHISYIYEDSEWRYHDGIASFGAAECGFKILSNHGHSNVFANLKLNFTAETTDNDSFSFNIWIGDLTTGIDTLPYYNGSIGYTGSYSSTIDIPIDLKIGDDYELVCSIMAIGGASPSYAPSNFMLTTISSTDKLNYSLELPTETASVPEPSTVSLLGMGMLVLGVSILRRRTI